MVYLSTRTYATATKALDMRTASNAEPTILCTAHIAVFFLQYVIALLLFVRGVGVRFDIVGTNRYLYYLLPDDYCHEKLYNLSRE